MVEKQTDMASCSSHEIFEYKKSGVQQMKENLKMLVHACQCDDLECTLIECKRMKMHVNHAKACEYQTNGGCTHCKLLFELCSYHAKSCKQENCSVLNCMRIKEKMERRRVTTEIVPAVIASLDATIEKESDREAKIRLIERSSESLLHAVQCQDAACANPSCPKKKIFVEHSKTCKLKAVGGCTVCKQLVELCGYHSKNCQTDNCTFPLCSKLKRGIRLISEGQTQNGKTTSNGISVAEEPIVILEQVRKNAVSMLAMTMSPNTDLSGANNAKTCDLIARAHKMEQGIFEMAKTDTEYHKILIDQVKCLAEANLSASLETLQTDLSDSKMI